MIRDNDRLIVAGDARWANVSGSFFHKNSKKMQERQSNLSLFEFCGNSRLNESEVDAKDKVSQVYYCFGR